MDGSTWTPSWKLICCFKKIVIYVFHTMQTLFLRLPVFWLSRVVRVPLLNTTALVLIHFHVLAWLLSAIWVLKLVPPPVCSPTTAVWPITWRPPTVLKLLLSATNTRICLLLMLVCDLLSCFFLFLAYVWCTFNWQTTNHASACQYSW